MTKRWAAIAIAVLFLAVNTLKVAIFDHLLVYPSLTMSLCLQSGIITKFIVMCFLFIALWRMKNPFFCILFYCLQLAYLFANLSYHAASEGYLHVTQYLGLFSEALELFKHSAIPHGGALGFLLFDAPLFAGVLLLYREISLFNRRFVFKKTPLLFAAFLVSFVYKWQTADAAERPMAILNDKYSCDNNVVHKYGLLAYNVIDLLKLQDSKSRINSLDYGTEFSGRGAREAHPNIIMVQVESMDARVVNTRHGNAWVTPFLHSLSNSSVYYPYVLSFHKAGSTSDCEFSIINSVEPFDDYPAMKLRNYDYPNSMLKPLVNAGYDVSAFHGNRGVYFNRNIAFKKMGFKTFYDLFAMELPEKGWGACDGEVFDFVAGKLKTQSDPFFYYIITMSSHEPFSAASAYYATGLFDDIPDETARNYFRSMSYVDVQLERFVKKVRETRENTYIFIYGDHAPPITDNVFFKRASFIEKGRLFEFVPLFIITPDCAVYKETLQAALFLDFASTILPASKTDFAIRSYGKDLLAFSHEKSPVPYGGETYLRRNLFNGIRGSENHAIADNLVK
jgi:phosphoglycerol transferase MdoB-like AlkP superfamily enzyme